MVSATQALYQVTAGMTVQDLRDLASTVDASVGNATLLLYSGDVGDVQGWEMANALSEASDAGGGKTVKTIADTEIGVFLNDPAFQQALSNAISDDPEYQGRTLSDVLEGRDASGNRINSTSFWDDASHNLVEQHSGDYRIVAPDLPAGSVADMTEIPTLLEKAVQSGQKVNGIDLQDWQDRYGVEKLLSGESAAQAELKELIQTTSKADLGNTIFGRDTTTGILHIDTNSDLGHALSLSSQELPSGVDGIRLSSVAGMDISEANLAKLVKYGDLLDKAGTFGDVLGITIAVAQATDAYNRGDYHSAAEILVGYVGNIAGGLSIGTVAAVGIVAPLVATLGVPVVAGMLVVGAAGIAAGYVGGVIGEKFFKDIYNDISHMGLSPYLNGVVDDYSWGIHHLGDVFRELGSELSDIIDRIKSLLDISETRGSPLVLDLDGNGIELASLTGTDAVYWDIDQDGFREASGWISGGDGLLAIDKNSDGFISDNGELFGNSVDFGNGFAALAVYDTNNDASITAADAAFSSLLVWIDANQNGYSEADELYSLDDLDITSISLNYTDTNTTNNGNTIKQTSTFVQDGTTRSIVDAWFAYDDVNSTYNGDYTLDVRTLFMPTLRGYGEIADLHIAMSMDNTGTENLLDMVGTLNAKTFAQIFDASGTLKDDVRDILFKWAGVDAVNPNGRGAFIDGQELAFLEKLMGQEFLQQGVSSNPYGPEAGNDLKEAFVLAFDNFYARLVAQSAGGELFTGDWSYNMVSDTFTGITGLDTDKLDALEANDNEEFVERSTARSSGERLAA